MYYDKVKYKEIIDFSTLVFFLMVTITFEVETEEHKAQK